MTLHPQVQALVAATAERIAGFNPKMSAGEMRAMSAGAAAPPEWDRSTAADFAIRGREGNTIPMRAHGVGVHDHPVPVILFFHGGGWATGDLDSYAATVAELAAQSGCIVAAVDYRLAPEHPFPAAVHDCRDALDWAASAAAELRCDTSRIALVGESAGGNLAAATALAARDDGGPKALLQVLVYAATDCDTERWPSMEQCAEGYVLTREMLRWFHAHYVTDADRTHPLAAPLCATDLSGLPPAFVATAEYDILRDQGEAFAKRLQDAGVPTSMQRYLGQIHGFYRFPSHFEGTAQLKRDVVAALRAALHVE